MTTPNQPNPPSLADFESACAEAADNHRSYHAGQPEHQAIRSMNTFLIGANFARTFTLGSAEVTALESSLKGMMQLIDDADLVRNTQNDAEFRKFFDCSARIINTLKAAQEALEAFAKVRE